MSIKAAARALGVSRGMLYRMIDDGRIRAIERPAYKAGRWVIPASEIERLRDASCQPVDPFPAA